MKETINPEIEAADKALTLALNDQRAFLTECKNRRSQEYTAKQGCTNCHGRGWVVTWDTLDSLSGCYAEYGACPNPTCNAKVTGPDASINIHPYDQNRGVTLDVYVGSYEVNERIRLDREVERAKVILSNSRAKWAIEKGKTIEVTRKSKTASVGKRGVVFWTQLQAQGPAWSNTQTLKIGAKDEKGEVFWTTGGSCKVIDLNIAKPKMFMLVGKNIGNTSKALQIETKAKTLWVPRSLLVKVNDVAWEIPDWFAVKEKLK